MPLRHLVLLCALFSSSALAALGDTLNAQSPEIRNQTSPISYVEGMAVYTSVTRSGIRISEYVNFQGMIVAIAWQGPSVPDMRQVLGPYFQTYVSEPPDVKTSHRHVELHTPDLVVQSSGHLRAFQGKAYLPKLLTSGIAVYQIR